MGLQKFRADKAGAPQADGAIPFYTDWVGGPTLALIRKCRIDNHPEWSPRTVYATNHSDTFFSIPGACRYKGKVIRGFITSEDNNLIFHAYKDKP